MRIAIVAESFLPQINGVTNSILRILEHLRARGDEALVLCPGGVADVPSDVCGFPVVALGAVPLPGYPDVRVGTSTSFTLEAALRDWAPDIVHLAAPFLLGYRGLLAANRLRVPTVAIYQTDVPSYATRYRMAIAEPLLWGRVRQIHRLATLTVAPTASARRQLVAHGIPRVGLWGRGVDSERFSPVHRDEAWRGEIAPGQKIVGYVGRLAPEKQVADLRVLADLPHTTSVIVGDGPSRDALQKALPDAHFLGQLGGHDLARVLASFDVFVHPGEMETFGQALQEALASGVPVIAPAKGGPLDIVRPSQTGWLYPPGNLSALRSHAADLLGDEAKRRAFGVAARESTRHATWESVCDVLIGHYERAIGLHAASHRGSPPPTAGF